MAATYPAIAQTSGTVINPVPGVKIDVSTSGTLRAVDMYAEEVADITVVHDLIETADKDTLMTFYLVNKTAAITFTYDGDGSVYDCLFVARPQVTWIAPGLWKVVSKLKGNLQ